MPWREGLVPQAMARVAIVAPEARWRRVLAAVADAGVVEPAYLSSGPHDLGASATSSADVDAQLDRVDDASVAQDGVRAIAGWAPTAAIAELAERLEPLGGAVVELARPHGEQPPTLLVPDDTNTPLRPLVDTYATIPYRDLDPIWFAAAAYVVMFGMMFGDVGDGALLAAVGLWMRITANPRVQRVRHVWPLVVAMGASAVVFGVLYGEFFGPTDVVPELWLRPLDEPTRLLAAGIGLGAVLLAIAYGFGVVNRWREGGVGLALYTPSGLAGAGLFVALAAIAGGALWSIAALWIVGVVLAAVALALVAIGLKAAAGPGAGGTLQAAVELFDVVIRLGSNVVSFARLAAFGLTHAALGQVVWDSTVSLWGRGPTAIAAVAVFVIGHLLAFVLEALVAGVQALRLEYYELFSRVFVSEGRPFRPWHVPSPVKELS